MENTEDHLVFKGFEAWVVVDGQPLPQFGVEYKESTREATVWIPSEAGKTFSVCYRKRVGQDDYDFTARVYLDGNDVSWVIYTTKNIEYSNVIAVSFFDVSTTETRDFMFNPVELTDDDVFLQNPAAAQVGEIKVVCRAAQALENLHTSEKVFRACPGTGKIHEQSKKGFGHQIKFGESKIRPHCILRRCPQTPVGDPVTFIFKYRPLEFLQAQGIAPRPTPTEPNNEEESEDDEVVTRERELLAELEQIRSKKRARKELERPLKRVKTEPIARFVPGEVIDLTEELE